MSDRDSRGSGSLAWFQCLAGASGDMLLGALVDAGAPLDRMQSAVDTLAVEPVRLSAERVSRHGLAATRVEVQTSGSEVRRTWRDIRELLAGADLPGPVRLRCLDVFTRLARAEAAVHGIAADDVHFHEVGALDAIADVVGVCTALESLGVGTAAGSPVVLGTGRTVTAHGVPPVPVPAVVALLADAGAPVSSGPAPYEMCTPTGVALLAATCGSWGGLPPMRVTAQGFNARACTGSARVNRVWVRRAPVSAAIASAGRRSFPRSTPPPGTRAGRRGRGRAERTRAAVPAAARPVPSARPVVGARQAECAGDPPHRGVIEARVGE